MARPRSIPSRSRASYRQGGFVLVTVVVFFVLLAVAAFGASFLTRTDLQVVSNIRDERQAFYIAEAGITEALLRLQMKTATPVTVNGRTFDARIQAQSGDPNWNAIILLGSPSPSVSGSTVTTPTIQNAAAELPYSTTAAGNESLRIRWELNGSGSIKQINGSRVLRVVSVGRAGNARRRVTQLVTPNAPLSTIVLNPAACSGLSSQGNGIATFPGSVHVNSTCSSAVSVGGSAGIQVNGGDISTVGGYTGNVSPTPTTGAPPQPDPLATLLPPSLVGMPVRSGTALSPAKLQINGTQTLQPGIYYGGIDVRSGGNATFQPGIYVMAGGGFSVSSNGQASGAGMMVYNTLNPTSPLGAGAFGAINITASRPVNLSAPTSGTYDGIIFFQDRLNTQQVSFTSNSSGRIDGVIYAANAHLQLSGGADLLYAQLVVGSLHLQGGPAMNPPANPILAGNGGAKRLAWHDY